MDKENIAPKGNLVRRVGAVVVAGASMVAVQAHAALPAAATAAFNDLKTDGLSLIDLVWPVVGAITVGFVLIGLFKRGASKV